MKNTLFVGKVYQRFDELGSTNDWLAETIAKSRPPEGMVVQADTQTAGRGQFGSRWQSEPGQNLLFSVLFYPDWLPLDAQWFLSMAVAKGLHEGVAACLPPEHVAALTLKWPNDLYWQMRKVAGILIQNSLSGGRLQSAVVGIGLNVNQTRFDPALPNPTSLALICGWHLDTQACLAVILAALEKWYLILKSGDRAGVKAAYEALLFRKDVYSEFILMPDGDRFAGCIRGVSNEGLLLVETGGELRSFDLKQIRWASPDVMDAPEAP